MCPRFYVWKKVVKHSHVMITYISQRLNLKHLKSKTQYVHEEESRRGVVKFANKRLYLYRLPLIRVQNNVSRLRSELFK